MVKILTINQFIHKKEDLPVVDVRSPVEYNKGHVPGSFNIPLFSDDERAQIGTVYRKQGSKKAVLLGESYAEPKIDWYLKESLRLSFEKKVIIYCFRGGMRSQRFSELLAENGFEVFRLESGYKSYRQYVQTSFLKTYPLIILGGKTGSGKTEILTELKKRDEQILDLEKMANHRGSAFGVMGGGSQPTNENFQNTFSELLSTLSLSKRIWVEDESLNIGRVSLPGDFFSQMKIAPLIVLILPKNDRVERLCRDYTGLGAGSLIAGIEKIQKRLGGERALEAINAVKGDEYGVAASIILEYYDKCYDYGLSKKENISINYKIIERDDPESTAIELIKI